MRNQQSHTEQHIPVNQRNRTRSRLHVIRRGVLGQSLVEFALTLPIFLLLLLGVVEFGRLAYAYVEVANAAHAGVQYGAQSHITASDNTGMALAATQDAANLVGLRATPTHFCACVDANGNLTPAPCTAGACARLTEFVQVNTSATVNTLFHYPGFPNSITLQGQAIMRVEQ